jgi:hypothetical protein
LTPSGCVVGSRVAMILKRLGVPEDKFESFMSAVYNGCCNGLGLTPERIGSYITNLIAFSRSVPVSQIPKYIQQKIQEKERMEQEIRNLEDKIKKGKQKNLILSYFVILPWSSAELAKRT